MTMHHKRAQELRWLVVDQIFNMWEHPEETLGEELTEDERIYLYNLGVRVGRLFNVRNHVHLPQ